MGKAQRFKILKTAISKYKAPVDTTGTAFYKYNQFRLGKSDYKVNGKARGDDELKSVLPFGLGDAATDRLVVQVSGRATDGNASNHGLSVAELGLANPVPADDFNENFEPAKIVVKTLGARTPQTSKITGVPYKKAAGDSFTFPFGRKVVTDKQFDRQLALYTLVEVSAANMSATFKPERMYGSGG